MRNFLLIFLITALGAGCATDPTPSTKGWFMEHDLGAKEEIYWDAEFSPDGKLFAAACYDGNAYVWDTESGKRSFKLRDDKGRVEYVQFSADSKYILISGNDALLFDASDGKKIRSLLIDKERHVSHAYISADGSYVFTDECPYGMISGPIGESYLTDIETGKHIFGYGYYVPPNESRISFYNDDARFIITEVGDGGNLRVWDTYRRKMMGEADHAANGISCEASVYWGSFSDAEVPKGQCSYRGLSRDGTTLLTVVEGRAYAWDLTNNDMVCSFGSDLGIISLSPDGAMAATSGYDDSDMCGILNIWDTRTGKQIFSMKGHTDGLRAIRWSQDSRRIGTAGMDNKAIIWRYRGREQAVGMNMEVQSAPIHQIGKLYETDDPIPVLTNALYHSDPVVRISALGTLRYYGADWDEVTKAIPDMLSDTDAEVRYYAIRFLYESSQSSSFLGDIQKPHAPIFNMVIDMLSDTNRHVLIAASSYLGDMGSSATSASAPLIKLLQHEDWNVFSQAAIALGQIGARDALPAIVRRYKSSTPKQKKEWSRIVSWFDEGSGDVTSILLDMAKSDDVQTRINALYALGAANIRDERAIDVLCEASHDPLYKVRVCAIKNLDNYVLTSEKAVSAIKLNIEDENAEVRKAALWSLMKCTSNPDMVISTIKRCLNDSDSRVQLSAVDAAGRLKTAAKPLVPGLISKLSPSYYTPPFDRLVAATAEALGNIGPDVAAAVPSLLTVAKEYDDHWFASSEAIAALQKMGPAAKGATQGLREILRTPDAKISTRIDVAAALCAIHLNDEEATEFLIKCIKTGGWQERHSSLYSIRELGSRVDRTIDAVINCLDDEENSGDAVYALNEMGEKAIKAIPELERYVKNPDADLNDKEAANQLLEKLRKTHVPSINSSIPEFIDY